MRISIKNEVYPEDIKSLDEEELDLLAYEIRDFLISNISKTGGHLSSNLGIVELTLALHKVFECPEDKIVWDVGHQTYVHKILTGRSKEFDKLRMLGGLSGFPKREESPYDTFDTGHSSTSISAALGMAVSRDLNGETHDVVAVIGDGALTGGQAYEGLNNAGASNRKFIVILNDNEMSISHNIGSMSQHLSSLRASEKYIRMKKKVKNAVSSIPLVGKGIATGLTAVRDSIKYLILTGMLFEEMGFTYLGPIDGHNIHELIDVLNDAKRLESPVMIHAITKKGKGYFSAEMHPGRFHGVSPFDPATGVVWNVSSEKSYSQVFGDTLSRLAADNKKIVAISAAMIDGVGLSGYAKRFPKRIFDVGIAEQHAVTFAAGLAVSGYHPVVAIYSTFLQRAYDQILIDVCMQKLPVVFALDRAGIVGGDGETHQGVFDLSYLQSMPNLTILAPSNKIELEEMLAYSLEQNHPCAIRYPRGEASDSIDEEEAVEQLRSELRRGEASVCREGSDVSIVAVGKMVGSCEKACEILLEQGISAELINVRFVKPLDTDTIFKSAKKTNFIVTVEDNMLIGGVGSVIASILKKEAYDDIALLSIGWPDEFIPHGKPAELEAIYGLNAESIAEKVRELFEKRKT